jgi:hypothetical protein
VSADTVASEYFDAEQEQPDHDPGVGKVARAAAIDRWLMATVSVSPISTCSATACRNRSPASINSPKRDHCLLRGEFIRVMATVVNARHRPSSDHAVDCRD